jgi:hypothetical protein
MQENLSWIVALRGLKEAYGGLRPNVFLMKRRE